MIIILINVIKIYYTGSCTYGDVRLFGGFTSTSGLVEVCAHNQWGTVCNDHWDNNDARGSAFFGHGNGSILLYNFQCTGNELSIFFCYHNGLNSIGSHDCSHSEDAGVVCLTSKYDHMSSHVTYF